LSPVTLPDPIVRGTSYAAAVRVSIDGAPEDLTGSTYAAVIRKYLGGPSAGAFTITTPVEPGVFYLTLTPAQTQALAVGAYVFDVFRTVGANVIPYLVRSVVNVVDAVNSPL
jgi:hypothetical protein